MLEDRSYGVVPVYTEGEGGTVFYLLIQHNAGHWAFPKGHAEGGEPPYEAACREFREETGIHDAHVLKDKSFIERYSFVRDNKRFDKTVQYFIGRTKNKAVTIQHEEIQAYKWAEFKEAEATITFSEGKRLLHEIKQFLADSGNLTQ
jgi:8-oxo-dGTP pyrophosphatase MutT (NUDIX family)